MSTYLITGGSGFIGSHLVENLLKQGHQVINVDNFHNFYDYKIKVNNTLESIGKEKKFVFTDNKEHDLNELKKSAKSLNYEMYLTDIRNLDELRIIFQNHSIDAIVHLAALAGVRPSIEKPIEYEEVNIKGTMNLWQLCNEFSIKKFVCASSSSVYGNNEKTPFAEDDVVDFAISPYAATKKAGEVIGHVYHSLYGVDMIQLRFFTVYGPRQRPDLAIHKFTKLIHEDKEIPFYGDGTTARDYTFIDDIIDGVTKSLKYVEENSGVYEILNLGESQTVTLAEMVSEIERALGKNASKKMLPMQPGDVNRTNAQITKAKKLVGYNPQTHFSKGIDIFVEWFKNK